MSSVDDDQTVPSWQRSSTHVRSYSTEEDYIPKVNDLEIGEVPVTKVTQRAGAIEEESGSAASVSHRLKEWHSSSRNLTKLEISGKGDLINGFSTKNVESEVKPTEAEPSAAQEVVASQKLLQLWKQLSCRWGA